ncbi:DUF6932 family protein [Isoptericola sp. NPDC058082]|uniref:DUF6932 family protein n=1 Tax=Isoptericola sp. NPDC058082 TaxID=3346331 RepID=UPI0036F1086D
MIPEFDANTGALPVGRFPATIPEIRAALVEPFPLPRREELWEEWLDATTILASHVRIACAWLGGSFLTTKPEPGDIDVVYWVEDTELQRAAADATTASALQTFTTPGWLHGVGLRVDAYVVPWVSNGTAAPRGPEDMQYLRQRGYWDDLWLRLRSGAKGAPPSRLDSIPRRGYLEVNLDGHE